jgi:membrane protein DedA with SNARE-associated domain
LNVEEGALMFVMHYGYIALFIALILGLVGLPVPDELLLAFAGYLIAQGELHFIPTIIVCFIGSMTGMSISFIIGRKLGSPFLIKYKRFTRMTPKRMKRMEKWFNRFGKFAVVFGYFLPGIRHFSAYSAGITNWTYRSFVSYAVIGAAIWSLTFITLGMWLHEYWQLIVSSIHNFGIIGTVIVISIIVFFIVKRNKPKIKNN